VGDSVQAFELMSDRCVRYAQRHIPNVTLPIGGDHPWYVLTDVASGSGLEALESALMKSLETGLVADAVVAKNDSEAAQLWRMRHSLSEAQKSEGASLKHDISVPTSRIADFVEQGERLVLDQFPGARLVTFGHVGDGNLHYNISQPREMDGEAFLADGRALTERLYDLADKLGGSFSAEHGVGAFKRAYLEEYRGGIELELMRRVKAALDPENRLNPGKVI
jgi:FAD/FMN-containing dehydrogenase